MVAQLFLVTPLAAEPADFPATLRTLLADAAVAAVLVRRGDRDEARYANLVKAVLPVAQQAGAALLVENDVALARRAGADGVHVTGDIAAVRAAIAALKPDGIVGAGPVATRHDAMTLGELDIDYLYFGAIGEPATPETRDHAAWWAETFEVPAVLSGVPGEDAAGCEFLALGESLWADGASPDAALSRAAEAIAS